MKIIRNAVIAAGVALAALFANVTPAAALTNHWSAWVTCPTIAAGYDDDYQFRAYWIGYTSTKWKVDKLEMRSTGSDVPAFKDIVTKWYDTHTTPDTLRSTLVIETALYTGSALDGGVSVTLLGLAGAWPGEETPRLQLQPVRATNGAMLCDKAIYEDT